MQLGKFSSDRDSALHFLCLSEWGNDSTGDVQTMGKYVWRISNTRDDIFGCFDQGNMEFDSVIEEWFTSEEIEDTEEFRKSLVGNFLVQEISTGVVLVLEYETQDALIKAFDYFKNEYETVWAGEEN